MAKMSVTNIRALKSLYSDQINKEYGIVEQDIAEKERELKTRLLDEFVRTGMIDQDANCEPANKYDQHIRIHSDGRVDLSAVYTCFKTIPFNTEAYNLKQRKIACCKAKKERMAELDQWEIDALTAPTIEDVPKFECAVIPSLVDCV